VAKAYFSAAVRRLTGGTGEIDVEGATLAEVVGNLESLHPGFEAGVLREGKLKRGVSVIVDGHGAIEDLDTGIGPDAQIHFLFVISGGAQHTEQHLC